MSFSEIARNFFHLLESLGKKENVKKLVNVWLLEDPIQKTETLTCGPFQLYFYQNLFFPIKTASYVLTKDWQAKQLKRYLMNCLP